MPDNSVLADKRQRHIRIGLLMYEPLLDLDQTGLLQLRHTGGWRDFPSSHQSRGALQEDEVGRSVYLATDDARKTVDAAAAHGGRVHAVATGGGDLGTVALAAGPRAPRPAFDGPATTRASACSESPVPRAGSSGAGDYEAALSFYRDVFRWDTYGVSDTPSFRYTTLVHGDPVANWGRGRIGLPD
jgi:predicted enzyme related to lactoylglutathione lyase